MTEPSRATVFRQATKLWISMPDKTYPLSAVCRVIGVTEDDLTNWSRRGHMGLISFGRGHERQIGAADVILAAIIKRCQDWGIPPSRSSEWAMEAQELMSTLAMKGQKLTQIVIRRYEDPDSETVSPNDHLMKKKARPGALLTLTIELEPILHKIRTELEAAGQGSD
jgi:hypothetical protein